MIVFANKQPDAWETLAGSLIKAGFIVNGSWPIRTEQPSRMRGLSSAALASSVWLVCKKRPEAARPGWDNKVLEEMRTNITQRLRDFWDAGIRGPDFVWAATGPALEAYSKHPVVKKADDPGEILTVSEFLSHVRRMVVDFVVGRVLSGAALPSRDREPSGDRGVSGDSGVSGDRGVSGDSQLPSRDREGAAEPIPTDRLDEPTAYYLLHRHDFGMAEAPVGACILYATACGLSDEGLVRDWDMLVKTGGDRAANEEEADEEADADLSPDREGGGDEDLSPDREGGGDEDLSPDREGGGDEDLSPDREGGGDEDLSPDREGGAASGSKVKLKPWNQRRGRSMGYEAPGGRPVPLVDRIHRLMHLWKGGDVQKVDEYLDEHGLRRHELFRRVLQSLIELAKPGSEERSLLESLSNHIGAKGAKWQEPKYVPMSGFDEE